MTWFWILQFKNWKINTLSSKSIQNEKAKFSHFDRMRGDKNQIFPTIAKENGFKRLVGSSGGNAGLAMAYAANQLKMPITLFIPTSTPEMMVNLIKVS